MFKKVFEYAGPHRKELYSATFIVLLSVLMGVLPFVLAYQVISPLIMGETVGSGYVSSRVIGVLVCLVLQAVLYGWGLNVSHKAAYNTLLRLRTALQKRFELLPLGFIQDKGTGTVKKLFVDDVDSLEVLLAHSLPEGIANLMIPLAIYVAMFFIDWKLALLSLASIPVSFAAMMIMYSVGMKKMGPYYMAGQKMNNTIIEYINGMEVVKVFNKDAESYERFRRDISDYRDYTLEWYKAAWPWMAVYSSLLPCTIILTLPLGAWFVLSGFSTLPDLILILCLSLSIGIPLLKSLGFLPTMPQLNYKISALEQVLETAPLKQTDDNFHGKNLDICFDHITFGYEKAQPGPDGKPVVTMDEVITDVSFTVKAGQKTALVGESGSGKSTLAKLLIHYYDPQQGSISIGGQKLTEMSLEALNSQISYVAQDQYLFNTSLLENIRMGKPDATDEEVLEAAKKAQCLEFLEKLPQGIRSMAGDAGKMLSGGQRQRISLARAILKNAPIIVLDEATAYADPENEEKMEAAIAELVKGKTLFVIAHKLPAIMNADQICVIAHGKLAAAGTHRELLQTCGEYQKLWKAAQGSAEWKVNTAKEEK
ncbi:MAG: ABC transporter ATP-binding protein/permease [Lachnospiraceae bacterium]|nr:ABC transporter ATP-binding protein/permease [Lachnospiraceae bacterium]